jgi:hypothetical protein
MEEFHRLKHRLEVDITPQCAKAMRNIPYISKADSLAEIERIREIVLNEILIPLEKLDAASVPRMERRVQTQTVRGLLDFLEHMTVKYSLARVRSDDVELGLSTENANNNDNANASQQPESPGALDPDKIDRFHRWAFLLEPQAKLPKMPGAWPED